MGRVSLRGAIAAAWVTWLVALCACLVHVGHPVANIMLRAAFHEPLASEGILGVPFGAPKLEAWAVFAALLVIPAALQLLLRRRRDTPFTAASFAATQTGYRAPPTLGSVLCQRIAMQHALTYAARLALALAIFFVAFWWLPDELAWEVCKGGIGAHAIAGPGPDIAAMVLWLSGVAAHAPIASRLGYRRAKSTMSPSAADTTANPRV